MNPNGRPRVEDKAKMTPICLYLKQRDFVKKMGGSKFVRELIDREIDRAAEAEKNKTEEKQQEMAKNFDSDSILIRRLKELSQNFSSEKP